jgi:hypothetical protein
VVAGQTGRPEVVRLESGECLLWVKSRHWGTSEQCPLYPQKQTLELNRLMSAAVSGQMGFLADVRVGSITDIEAS